MREDLQRFLHAKSQLHIHAIHELFNHVVISKLLKQVLFSLQFSGTSVAIEELSFKISHTFVIIFKIRKKEQAAKYLLFFHGLELL